MIKKNVKRVIENAGLEGPAHKIRGWAQSMFAAGSRPVRLLQQKFNSQDHVLEAEKFKSPNSHVFFGYYDISPFSYDEDRLLALHVPFKNVTPGPEEEITVGYYSLKEDGHPFHEIGKTATWCWQQGCRLQWYPGKSNKSILYNRLVDGQYGCVIQDTETKKINREFKRPVYSLSRDGHWGLSLNFSRLQRLRPGYGYVNLPDDTFGEPAPEHDGIWRINMQTGREDFLFSIPEILQLEPLETMNGAEHYFNHILFNPDGTRFMFFHLWMKDGKRFNRLITCNVDGTDRYPLINEGHVSHYTWKSNNELLAYSTHNDTGMHYHLYEDKSAERTVIGKGDLDRDGHPSYSPDGTLLLTDTYPDKYREQNLLIYNPDTGKLYSLSSFYSPFKYNSGEFRCDLHPRWSPSSRYICIDTPYKSKRTMHLINLKYLLPDLHNTTVS